MILKALRECLRASGLLRERKRVDAPPPRSAAEWIDHARTLKHAGRTAAAVQAYERAIEADPREPAGYVNLGFICLTQLGDPARAETLLRRAVALAPQSVEAQTNLGLALHDQGRWAEAAAHYEALVSAQPDAVEYRWHRACALLGTGDFERGWEEYEARKRRPAWWRSPLPFPEWDGKPLPDGALLIYAEQGVGDEIMFASCIPDVLRVAPECVIECDERVASLFSRSFPAAVVHGVNRKTEDLSWLSDYPRINAQCAIGSLPRFFRRSREAFPGEPYLVADPARVNAWRQTLNAGDGKRNVGIAWRGGTYQTRRELRSTGLTDWAPVLANAGARFYALQAASPEELAATDVRALDGVDRDLDALAAAIMALDLVVTVQGTVAHLAGALGKPVWVLLSSSAEWRYLDEGERMPWYGSAHLFRQPTSHAWDRVFAAVSEALRR